eukprot:TRINITY_DN99041_c0_g2_i1.p1 TRINITY_DN99041_c0_g2~~TRINITY_DN99041_c0_g2_i1.p1  ORF type:complete len:606 (-),score=184.06 TRINITY_DN99041_c0_g2_i1:642-2459(-)
MKTIKFRSIHDEETVVSVVFFDSLDFEGLLQKLKGKLELVSIEKVMDVDDIEVTDIGSFVKGPPYIIHGDLSTVARWRLKEREMDGEEEEEEEEEADPSIFEMMEDLNEYQREKLLRSSFDPMPSFTMPGYWDVLFKKDKIGLNLLSNLDAPGAIVDGWKNDQAKAYHSPEDVESVVGSQVVAVNGMDMRRVDFLEIVQVIQFCRRPVTIRFYTPPKPKPKVDLLAEKFYPGFKKELLLDRIFDAVKEEDTDELQRIMPRNEKVATNLGVTPLMLAVKTKSNCFGALISNKDNCNQLDVNGLSALYRAILFGTMETMERLMRACGGVMRPDNSGRTPLILAACSGRPEMVEYFITRGARINEMDSHFGWSSLHWAVHKSDEAMVKLLLSKGASLFLESKLNETPYMVAKNTGNGRIIDILWKEQQMAPAQRVDCDLTIGSLWVGTKNSLTREFLESLGFDAVVMIHTSDFWVNDPLAEWLESSSIVKVMKFSVLSVAADKAWSAIKKRIDVIQEFVEGFWEREGRVLIVCGTGLSLGPALTVGIMIKSLKLTIDEAVGCIQRSRNCVDFSQQFIQGFKDFKFALDKAQMEKDENKELRISSLAGI